MSQHINLASTAFNVKLLKRTQFLTYTLGCTRWMNARVQQFPLTVKIYHPYK